MNIQGFTNPATTTSTSSFTVETQDSTGAALDSRTTGITLTATVGTLTAASMTSESDVVGEITTVTFNITLAHDIPTGGGISISFPKWNPDATSGTIFSMIQGTYACTGVQSVETNLNCIFSNDILNISNTNPSSNITANTVCTFTVTSIRNPISTAAKTGISLTTLSSDGGSIDSGSLSLTVSTAATISSGTAVADGNNTVSELATIDLTFSIPVPLDIGCVINITFPSEMQLSTTNLKQVTGFGLFGSATNLSLEIDTANNIFTVNSACDVYRTTDFDALIKFANVTSPLSVKPSNSFVISITTSSGDAIASVNSGILYTASEGQISSITATPTATTVGTVTSVLFSFVPAHKIPVSSQISVTLPTEVSIADRASDNCTLSNQSEIQLNAT